LKLPLTCRACGKGYVPAPGCCLAWAKRFQVLGNLEGCGGGKPGPGQNASTSLRTRQRLLKLPLTCRACGKGYVPAPGCCLAWAKRFQVLGNLEGWAAGSAAPSCSSSAAKVAFGRRSRRTQRSIASA